MRRARVSLAAPEGVRVTKLTRHEDGHYTANLSLGGETIPVQNARGPWTTMEDDAGVVSELLVGVQAKLVARVREAEREAEHDREEIAA